MSDIDKVFNITAAEEDPEDNIDDSEKGLFNERAVSHTDYPPDEDEDEDDEEYYDEDEEYEDEDDEEENNEEEQYDLRGVNPTICPFPAAKISELREIIRKLTNVTNNLAQSGHQYAFSDMINILEPIINNVKLQTQFLCINEQATRRT